MTSPKYNFWFAITYELLNDFSEQFKALKNNKLIRLILNYCKRDWVLWKIETTLNSVDIQAEELKKYWKTKESPRYLVIEHEPDGSKAQELLGGTIEIKSNFKRE